MFESRMNSTPTDFKANKDLPEGLMDLLLPLHRAFTPRQRTLIAKRAQILAKAHSGDLPDHLPPSVATESDWRIELPEWCQDQRNQMTGPADDAELCVKMLNSAAPGVMLDLEDSMANLWCNLTRGISNILAALRGELSYFDKKRNEEVATKESKTVIWLRARGLHLSQAGVLKNRDELMPASLFDVAMLSYQFDPAKSKHPLSFYIPKSESAEEAIWWSDLFKALERGQGWPPGYIKCMALVESHPLAYQLEEFLYNLRDHILGLNLGRWDYMASLIHFNLRDPKFVLPDRNTIPHDVQFFQNLRELIPEICHRRGILAIGGMTALFPDRTNPELNARALKVLAEDKNNEASCLMDGAWTGHPDQNVIAVKQFPFPNQAFARRPDAQRYPDLRPIPKGVGKISLTGTRAAVRTVIRYRNGVLNGRGASLLDGYMEDLATDRIYRLMIAQRMKHSEAVPIADEHGNAVKHTSEFITQLFDEELDRIIRELPPDADTPVAEKYRKARKIGERMIERGEFDPV